MNDTEILNVFYTKIVPEAQKGRINCYFVFNIAFNMNIENKEISRCKDLDYEGILIPTLKVTNKEVFDDMLVNYVRRAQEFYSPHEFLFLNDLNVMDTENIAELKEEYLIKYIICTLLANASITDFNYPISFLRSRIAMFDNKIIDHDGELDLGYIDSIGARIFITEEVSPIKAETPYRITSYLQYDDGYKLLLPEIYVGDSQDKYHLYGIQKTTKNAEIDEKSYLKQIRRGLISKINGAPEHYFLAVMLFLSLCSDKEIEVIPFLVERWNAKRIAICNKTKRDLDSSFQELEIEQEKIQSNITDTFIRYFTKLENVSNGLEFTSIPYESDANLHININEEFQSRAVAFNELFKLVKEYKSRKDLGK